SAITPDEPVLSTEEPDNSLSMGDEHLDTILAMESNEFIKSSVENLIPIPNEFAGELILLKSIPPGIDETDCDFEEDIHANKDVHFCPVCNTGRWKDSNIPGKKVPKKVLRYFPIIPRLQRLYKSSHTAKEMTWHATGKCTEPGKMQHPVDGKA
nr:hypothetical protein [Tanacetum cinerariifolium]